MRLANKQTIVGCVLISLAATACSRTPAETLGVTLDYDGVRYEGKVSFPDYDPSTHRCTTTARGKCLAGSSISGTVEGDLPIASASLDIPTVDTRNYVIHVTHDAADQSIDRQASGGDASALPYAVCVVTEDEVGHAVACMHSMRPCSITLVTTP